MTTTVRHAPAPSKVLGEIQMMAVAELTEHPTAPTITLDRRSVVILQAALGELIGQIEVLEEAAAEADRLTAELAIVRADRERWRTAAETYHAAWAREVDRDRGPLRLVQGGEVVDLTEVLRSAHRGTCRPMGPEGGAA